MTAALTRLDKPLRLHPLTYLDEGDEVTVGRADINSYGMFPADGAALLRFLEAGHTPNEGAAWYQATYGETVDIGEFLEILEEFEMIVPDGAEIGAPQSDRWQRLGKVIFSPIAFASYFVLVAAAIKATVFDPVLRPGYQNLFFTKTSLVVLTIGVVFGQVPLILLHEAFHALAGRRLGLNTKLSLGRRLYFVVAVTSLDGLVAVPRRKRYLPLAAGVLVDLLVVASFTLLAAPLIHASGAAHFIGKLLLAMAFASILRLVWQCYFFLQTDLYFMATTVMGCNDLQTVAREMLRNRLFRLIGKPEKLVDESTWHPRDRTVAQWYSWLLIAGYGFMLCTLVFVALPTGAKLTLEVYRRLLVQHSPARIADSVAFLILNFGELAFAGLLAARAALRRQRPSEA